MNITPLPRSPEEKGYLYNNCMSVVIWMKYNLFCESALFRRLLLSFSAAGRSGKIQKAIYDL